VLDFDNSFHWNYGRWLDIPMVRLFRSRLHGGSDTPRLPMGTPLVRLVLPKREFLESIPVFNQQKKADSKNIAKSAVPAVHDGAHDDGIFSTNLPALAGSRENRRFLHNVSHCHHGCRSLLRHRVQAEELVRILSRRNYGKMGRYEPKPSARC